MTIQVGGFANFIGSHFWNFQVRVNQTIMPVFCLLGLFFNHFLFLNTSPLWLINICSSLKYFWMDGSTLFGQYLSSFPLYAH